MAVPFSKNTNLGFGQWAHQLFNLRTPEAAQSLSQESECEKKKKKKKAQTQHNQT